jgi:hypothetical protein
LQVVENAAEEYIKNPPNNLNLADPTEQSRTNDLIGARDTAPVRPIRSNWDCLTAPDWPPACMHVQISDGPTAAEQERAKKLAAELDKKGTL